MRVTNTGRWIRLLVVISLVLSSVPLLSALPSCPTPVAGTTTASAIRLSSQGVTFQSTPGAPCSGTTDVLTYQWQYSLNQTTWKFFDGTTETAAGGVFAGATVTHYALTGVATPYAAPVLTITNLPAIVPQIYIQLQVTDTTLSPQGSSVTNSVTLEVYNQNAWFPDGTPGSVTPATFVRGALLTSGHVVAVGFDGTLTDTNAPFYLDSATSGPGLAPTIDAWTLDAPTLPYQLQRPSATLLPTGQVLIAGGLRGTAQEQSASYLYSEGLSSGNLTSIASLSKARDGQTATLLTTGQVLVTGGTGDNTAGTGSGAALTSAELFTPSGSWTGSAFVTAGSWSYTATTVVPATPATSASGGVTTSLNIPRMHHTATLLRDGTVLIVGGNGDNQNISAEASAEIYNPVTGTFVFTSGNLATARAYHTATLLPNGQVLIAGGIGITGKPLNSAEIYDPTTKLFTPVASLMQATRAQHTATLLAPSSASGWANGKVLLAGGGFGTTFLNSSEYFSYTTTPATDGTFTVTNPLNTGRDRQGSFLVDNGTVITFGGNASNTTLATTAETFVDISKGTPSIPNPATIVIGPALTGGTTGTATGGFFGETFAYNTSIISDGQKPVYYATCSDTAALANETFAWTLFGLDPLTGNNSTGKPAAYPNWPNTSTIAFTVNTTGLTASLSKLDCLVTSSLGIPETTSLSPLVTQLAGPVLTGITSTATNTQGDVTIAAAGARITTTTIPVNASGYSVYVTAGGEFKAIPNVTFTGSGGYTCQWYDQTANGPYAISAFGGHTCTLDITNVPAGANGLKIWVQLTNTSNVVPVQAQTYNGDAFILNVVNKPVLSNVTATGDGSNGGTVNTNANLITNAAKILPLDGSSPAGACTNTTYCAYPTSTYLQLDATAGYDGLNGNGVGGTGNLSVQWNQCVDGPAGGGVSADPNCSIGFSRTVGAGTTIVPSSVTTDYSFAAITAAVLPNVDGRNTYYAAVTNTINGIQMVTNSAPLTVTTYDLPTVAAVKAQITTSTATNFITHDQRSTASTVSPAIVAVGDPVSFSTVASSGYPAAYTYQWQSSSLLSGGFGDISVASYNPTTATMTIPAVYTTMAYRGMRVKVKNSVGYTNSTNTMDLYVVGVPGPVAVAQTTPAVIATTAQGSTVTYTATVPALTASHAAEAESVIFAWTYTKAGSVTTNNLNADDASYTTGNNNNPVNNECASSYATSTSGLLPGMHNTLTVSSACLADGGTYTAQATYGVSGVNYLDTTGSASLSNILIGNWTTGASNNDASYDALSVMLPAYVGASTAAAELWVAGGTNISTGLVNDAAVYTYSGEPGWSGSTNFFQKGPHLDGTATLLLGLNGIPYVAVIGGSDGQTGQTGIEYYNDPINTFGASNLSLSQPTTGHVAALLPSQKILVAGGQNGWNDTLYSNAFLITPSAFPGASDALATSNASLGTARAFSRSTVLEDGAVLITGGVDAAGIDNAVDIYDPWAANYTAAKATTPTDYIGFNISGTGGDMIAQGKCTTNPTTCMTTSRLYHTATLLNNGNVLIVGGINASGTVLGSIEVFNATTNTFAAFTCGTGNVAQALTNPRLMHNAVLLENGSVLITGGVDKDEVEVKTTEIIDPSCTYPSTTNAVAVGNVLNVGRAQAVSALLPNGTAIVVGGLKTTTETTLSSSEIFTAIEHYGDVPAAEVAPTLAIACSPASETIASATAAAPNVLTQNQITNYSWAVTGAGSPAVLTGQGFSTVTFTPATSATTTTVDGLVIDQFGLSYDLISTCTVGS